MADKNDKDKNDQLRPVLDRFYEMMFLVDSNWIANEGEAGYQALESRIQKHGGRIIRLDKWDDRKLAYPIKVERTTHKRGTYVLAAVEGPTTAPALIRRDCEFDPNTLRVLILSRRDDEIEKIFDPFPETDSRGRPIPPEELEARAQAEAEAEAAASEAVGAGVTSPDDSVAESAGADPEPDAGADSETT